MFNCNHNIVYTKEQKEEMIRMATINYRKFMVSLGIDIEKDPNSKDTPMRVAKMFVNELCKGRYEEKPNVKSFPNQEQYDQIIFTNCDTTSLCAHHMIPISNKIFIGVLSNPDPNSRLIGLSKYTRIAEWISNRPTIQEDMTKQIHKEINEVCVDNKGVMVYIIGQHGCVTFRGVKQTNSRMITSCVSGAFKEDQSVKDEFMNMVNNILGTN
jgi:GTP cyclohydrolase IA